MNPTPLLDFWQKPADAGEPVAIVATTFAFEPDFFERNCLARFLEVSSVNEDTGSIDDIVASIELHELLQKTRVTVLADRSAPVQRSSLLWDVLGCSVEGGLLHSKVAVLMWEEATRVILGSANLTAAGYRRQIELGLAADLGPGCLFPPDVLGAIADELGGYLDLVPGHAPDLPVFRRAASTLELFRARIARQATERSTVRVAFAPTNPRGGPLERFELVWSGPRPTRATHLSPFWDVNDATALRSTRELLNGRPADSRSQRVAVVLGPRGQTALSRLLAEAADGVHELKPLDDETRTLHAKCLLIESDQLVAALVGSSNHTKAGLGLAKRRHREMNVWLCAPQDSKEGKALLKLVQLGGKVPADAEEIAPSDEDEVELPALPACFGLCRLARVSQAAAWELRLGISPAEDMPADWSVCLADDTVALTRQAWEAGGSPPTTAIAMEQETLPMYVRVRWDGLEAPWAVLADDRHALPPGKALSSLRAQHLLAALASGRSLSDIIREELERKAAGDGSATGLVLDPLRRFEVEGSLLRKGRALAASFSAMQRRLEHHVIDLDSLRARLAGPLGPEFVALKIAEAHQAGEQSRAEAIFSIAELALAVGRVNWTDVLKHVDAPAGRAVVEESLGCLDMLRLRVGDEPADLAAYASRAIEEARQCLAC